MKNDEFPDDDEWARSSFVLRHSLALRVLVVNPLHPTSGTERMGAQEESSDDANSLDCAPMRLVPLQPMSPAGVELSSDFSVKMAIGDERAALLRAFGPVSIAADLAEVIDAWPTLSEAVRVSILVKVREASG